MQPPFSQILVFVPCSPWSGNEAGAHAHFSHGIMADFLPERVLDVSAADSVSSTCSPSLSIPFLFLERFFEEAWPELFFFTEASVRPMLSLERKWSWSACAL